MELSERDKEILDVFDKAIHEARKEISVGRYPKWLGDLNYCCGYFRGRFDVEETMDRYTMKHIEARVESVNRRLESNNSVYRIEAGNSNGYTNLYEIRADGHSHITAGTKREIAHYLSAMMKGIDLLGH